jgi:23S rRNA pseudouridine1911/1915/1917 synthase
VHPHLSEPKQIQALRVPRDAAGRRLDHWLVAQLPEVSRVRVQQLIEQGKIRVNGVTPKPSLRLRGNEEVVVTGRLELPPLKAFAEAIPLDVVYEDADLAVINKPAGMTVHAGSGKSEAGIQGTLVNALLHRFGALSAVGDELRPGIVHRLDKETSGLIVVAKTDAAHRELARQFAARQVKKTYLALVHGWLKKAQGTVDAPIRRDMVRRARMTTRGRSADRPGRSAVTHWKVLQEIDGEYGKFSLLEVKIETGRTHQIRVHLASLGHPVVGDTLYGAPRKIASYGETASLERNFLHAAAIQFLHPRTGKALAFEQPLPGELESFFRRIGG